MQSADSCEGPNNLMTKERENSMIEARPVMAFAEISKHGLKRQMHR